MNLQIKTATKGTNIFQTLSEKEGWNPGLEDFSLFKLIDPHGFFIGYLNHHPIACISNVKHSENSSFIGCFIVKEEYRGKGYGKEMWLHALEYTKHCNIGLDSVTIQESFYKMYGFKPFYLNKRYRFNVMDSKHSNPFICNITSAPFELINQYDKAFNTGDRTQFLKAWVNSTNSYAVVYIENNVVLGYGVIRKCVLGHKIGPLFSDNPEIASNILKALCKNVEEGQPVFIDIPEINGAATPLISEFKMQFVFETIRMYTKELPNFPFNKIYGVTTLEVG